MNVFDYFFESSQGLDKDFLLGGKETVSYKKLFADSQKVAAYLRENVGQDKPIILLSPNSVFFITAYLGILKSGNFCIPLNYAIERSNLDYILETTESTFIFCTTALSKKLSFGEINQVITESGLNDLLKEDRRILPIEDFNEERLAEIIFTSGSTGKPKGVMLSHKNLIANTESIVSYLKLSDKDIMGVVLPFFYCYGLSLLHTHLRVGGSIVLNNNFIFLGSVINDLKKYKCTGFAGVPSHFQVLLKKSKTFKTTEFPDLKYVTQAGGKLHTIFIQEFIDAFHDIAFYVMYGQTEATARLSYLDPHMLPEKIGSIGKAIPGVALKVCDSDGSEVPAGLEGELFAQGDNIMPGYYKDPEGTTKALKGGWLHTGDLARMDEDGYFYISGRQKEIIKVGGKRVSPKEIEEVILSVPEVVDCTIRGVEDELLGEAIEANIVSNKTINNEALKEKILKESSKKLAPHKIPQQFNFKESLTTDLTGKKKI
ncbi:MAG: AMP-binding protein [Muriicola sp.]|nr:AMP-binding protein [Muriicola sp.]